MFYIMFYLRRISRRFPESASNLARAFGTDSRFVMHRRDGQHRHIFYSYIARPREKNDVLLLLINVVRVEMASIARNSRDERSLYNSLTLSLSIYLYLAFSDISRISRSGEKSGAARQPRGERETRTINARHNRENTPVRDHRASYRDKTILSVVRRHARAPTL